MQERRVNGWLCICLLMCWVAGPLRADGASSTEPREQLLDLLRRTVPTAGAVHLQFYEPARQFRVMMGFDYSTGAFYFGHHANVVGVSTTGVSFSGPPVPDGVAMRTDRASVSERWTLEPYIPGIITWEFLRDPELLQRVEVDAEGFRVTRTSPGGKRYPVPPAPGFVIEDRTLTYHIDKNGRVTRIGNFWRNGSAREFDYSDAELAKVGAVRDARKGTQQLIEFRHEPTASAAAFERDSVEALAVRLHLIADSPEAVSPSTPVSPPSVRQPPVQTIDADRAALATAVPADNFWRRTWRWWAAGTGVGVIVVALWLKRRAA